MHSSSCTARPDCVVRPAGHLSRSSEATAHGGCRVLTVHGHKALATAMATGHSASSVDVFPERPPRSTAHRDIDGS